MAAMRKLASVARRMLSVFRTGGPHWPFAAVAPRRSPIEVEGGNLMFLHDHDTVVSAILAEQRIWEPFETQVIRRHVHRGDVVLDIGANIGYFTLLLAGLVGPEGRVFAFEPDPENFDLLRKNVRLNGYGNVVLVPKAVSDRTGESLLHLCPDNKGDHRLYDSRDGRPSVRVQAVRLDDYFRDQTLLVNFIKMDIQGGEAGALRGMARLLARAPRLKMLTEFWPIGLQRSGAEPNRYLEMLSQHGFRIQQLDESHQQINPAYPTELLDTFRPEVENFTNLLCVKESATERPLDLQLFERRVSSQNGEDGILEEIFHRVGTTNRFFVEFGAGDGVECNAARLTVEEGWHGLFMEADAGSFDRLQNRCRRDGVACVRATVTSENIEELLADRGVPRSFDLLSIDIDGNDYWVWSALRRWRPRVVVIEYNASHRPPRRWVMAENANHRWDGTDYFGASLASLAALAEQKGYTLVGTDSRGVNAFFVLKELAPQGKFIGPDVERLYSPPRYGPEGAGHPHGVGPHLGI